MRLIDCFALLMAYVSLLVQKEPAARPDYDRAGNDIARLIGQGETAMQQGGVNPGDFDMARFAVFAWIDERIMNSDWEGRHQWQKALLQRRYYETVDAGEIFFDRLNRIGLHQRDVREVYYVCLAMGFAGQFRNEGDAVLLEGLKNENLKILTGSSMGVPAVANPQMFPEAYATVDDSLRDIPRKKRFSPVTGIILGMPVLLYGVLYLVYRFVLNNVGESFIKTVS